MKRPHLLRVEVGAENFGTLVAAARDAGLRVGWLDLRGADIPRSLAKAAAGGVLRAVGVGTGATVSVKPRKGSAVLDDLLREHFVGCVLVLVAGSVAAPLLARDGDSWKVTSGAGSSVRLDTEGLVRALRKPLPICS
jgi:hypothetical protein